MANCAFHYCSFLCAWSSCCPNAFHQTATLTSQVKSICMLHQESGSGMYPSNTVSVSNPVVAFWGQPQSSPQKGLSKVRLDWREDVQRDRVVLSGVKFSPLYGERDKSSCSTEQRKLQLIPKTHAQWNSAAGTPPGPASSCMTHAASGDDWAIHTHTHHTRITQADNPSSYMNVGHIAYSRSTMTRRQGLNK
jgi:hypothetical protein